MHNCFKKMHISMYKKKETLKKKSTIVLINYAQLFKKDAQ